MTEEMSLKDQMDIVFKRLVELEDKKEVKRWYIPWFSNLSKAKAKKNWVLICYINENKTVKFVQAQIDEGVILIDGKPHTVNSDEILIYKNKPFIIVPSWSISPFSPIQNLKETEAAGHSSMGWEYLMNYMKKTEIKSVKNMGMVIWIVLGLVILGGGYYLIKNGGFH